MGSQLIVRGRGDHKDDRRERWNVLQDRERGHRELWLTKSVEAPAIPYLRSMEPYLLPNTWANSSPSFHNKQRRQLKRQMWILVSGRKEGELRCSPRALFCRRSMELWTSLTSILHPVASAPALCHRCWSDINITQRCRKLTWNNSLL